MVYTNQSRRAFSLIEVVIAVVVLAIAVPPTLNLLDSAASGRVDAINTTRATYLSTAVMETVIADLASSDPNLGFDALADSGTYLTTPTTGLYARIESITDPYTSVGFKYSVSIGELVSADGTVSGNASEDIFRIITVRVGYTSASTASYQMPVSIMVSAL